MKKWIKFIILILTTAIILFLCERVLLLKSEDGIEQIESFYLQKDNTVDALFMGNSHTYCNINTGVLWDEYGIAGYNLGGAEQPYWNTYYYLKEALKTQRPQVIMLEISAVGINPTDYQPENWLICNTYGMKWNANKIAALKASVYEDYLSRLAIPMNSIHSRYDELTREDFTDPNRTISNKGFDPREGVRSFNRPDVSGVTEMTAISQKSEKYLLKIIELTKEEEIPLVIFTAPYVVTEDSQKVYNYVFNIAEENQIPCVDFNQQYDAIGLDFTTDMADNLHLNRDGNAKFSKYLGNYLVEQYGVPDRRGMEDYASWDEDALNQRQDNAAYTLRTTGDFGEYLKLIANENYLSFVFTGYNMDDMEIDAQIVEMMQAAGIGASGIMNGQSILLGGKDIWDYTDIEEFEWVLEDQKSHLMCCREKNQHGDRFIKVFVGDKQYDLKNEGVSILVYDRQLDRVVDNVNVDTQNQYSMTRLQ